VINLAYSSGNGSDGDPTASDPDTRPDAVVPLRPRRM